MRITYIVNARIPTERANGIQTIHTCEALAKTGAHVELVVPWRHNPLKEDLYRYYGVQRNFSVKKIPAIDLVWLGKWGFVIHEYTFMVSAVLLLLFSSARNVIYVRGERLAKGILRCYPRRDLFFLRLI